MVQPQSTTPAAAAAAPQLSQPAAETASTKSTEVDEELSSLLHRRKELERHLASIEAQIYNQEGKYLEQTSMGSGGNIARGFDGCIGGAAGQQAQQPQTLFGGSANGAPFHDSERIFSHSSATYRKSLQMIKELEKLGGRVIAAAGNKKK